MSYRLDNLKKRKSTKTVLILLLVVVVFYFFSESILRIGYSVVSAIAVPLWRSESNIRQDIFALPALIRSKKLLVDENDSLRQSLADINVELQSYKNLQKENDNLMAELGNVGEHGKESVSAPILSGPNIPPYDGLIIDAGLKNGLSLGDKVLYGENELIGEVSQLYNQTAKVTLYSGFGISTDAILSGAKDVHVVAEGFGSGDYYFELPSSILVNEGEFLLIPGGGSYILGKVGNIQLDITTASQKVLVTSSFNIRSARFVRVTKG